MGRRFFEKCYTQKYVEYFLCGWKIFRHRLRIDNPRPAIPTNAPIGSGRARRKIALCWIGIGEYNILFREMYESFNARFCNDLEKTFFVFTDRPGQYADLANAVVYDVAHACRHTEFVLFRKWKYLLMAEDRFLGFDYVAFVNGNMVCKEIVASDEIIDPARPLTVITHPCDKWTRRGWWNCNPRSLASFMPKADWRYKQAGFNISTVSEFLRMANTIEGWRHLDKARGCDRFVPWHDETYANRYFYENRTILNVLDGRIYCHPRGIPELESDYAKCKLYTRSKENIYSRSRLTGADLYTLEDWIKEKTDVRKID